MANEPDDLCFDISELQQDLFDVLDALERASVDAREQRIVWHNGSRLSIEETARKIHGESGWALLRIQGESGNESCDIDPVQDPDSGDDSGMIGKLEIGQDGKTPTQIQKGADYE